MESTINFSVTKPITESENNILDKYRNKVIKMEKLYLINWWQIPEYLRDGVVALHQGEDQSNGVDCGHRTAWGGQEEKGPDW